MKIPSPKNLLHIRHVIFCPIKIILYIKNIFMFMYFFATDTLHIYLCIMCGQCDLNVKDVCIIILFVIVVFDYFVKLAFVSFSPSNIPNVNKC